MGCRKYKRENTEDATAKTENQGARVAKTRGAQTDKQHTQPRHARLT